MSAGFTPLTKRKSRLAFQTDDTVFSKGRHREVCVEAQPGACALRLKGLRHAIYISWDVIYAYAAKLETNGQTKERIAARKKIRAERLDLLRREEHNALESPVG